MSVSKRKIGLYYFEFVNQETNIELENEMLKSYFQSLIDTIIRTDFASKKVDVTTSNKFYYMVDITGTDEIRNLRFESAKTGHRPQLIDEETGLKRENPKNLHEGEAEITHLSIKPIDNRMIVALEERNVGITIGQFSAYLNKFISHLPIENQHIVEHGIIPYDGFINHLNDFSRITVGHLMIEKQDLGSAFLNLADLGDSVRTPVKLTFKADNRSTISRTLIKAWDRVRGRSHQIKRIRIEGNSHDGTKISLDTDSLKMIKHLDVDLIEEIGIVKSEDMFEKLELILRDIE